MSVWNTAPARPTASGTAAPPRLRRRVDVPGVLGRWALSAVLLAYGLWIAAHRGTYTWLDHGDLMVHEAGHFFFRFLGHGMHVAGGTLMQLLLPALLAAHFLRHHYRTGAQLMGFWLGQSFVNASVYAADARARALPLLGGDTVFHDWHTMLSAAGLLWADTAIGYALFGCGLAVMLGTVLLPLRMGLETEE